MLPALVSLKSLIKTKSYHIDFPFFRLHYQATVCLLLAFCLTLTAKVLFGDTIDCFSRSNGGHVGYYDNLCYSIGTFSRFKLQSPKDPKWLENSLANTTITVDPESRYIYPGVLLDNFDDRDPKMNYMWHTYYQYVPIILFIQAVLFYFPHYLWKIWENGVISALCKRLHEHRFSPNEYLDSNYDVIQFLQSCFLLNRSLVYKYYFCHVLCLLNLLVQIFSLNIIFNYQFITYGYKSLMFLLFETDTYGMKLANEGPALSLRQTNLNSPMDFVFPKVTNCFVEMAGEAGGQANSVEYMCVLPLNILHDKFFLILWWWLLVLIISTVLQIVYDSLYTMLPFFREQMFTKRYGSYLYDSDIYRSATLPEIFLLDIIGQNCDKFAFSSLLRKLNKDDWTGGASENQSIV